jgi:LysR family hydrogen peroxide-inducible transcriptional activator
MNIRQIEYVLAVAEQRHFETAAEQCFISQSTLSTMISKFEEEIGIHIFDRKRKPVEITNEGQLIIDQLRLISKNIDQLNQLVDEMKGVVKGKLKIAVIPTIAPFLLPLFLQQFAQQFPELTIEVREHTTQVIIEKLKKRELDLGILSTPLLDDDIEEHHLYDEPFVMFDTTGKYMSTLKVEDIVLDDLWLMEEGHCMRTQIVRLCELKKSKLNKAINFEFRAGSIDSLLRIVKANHSTTLIPYLATLDFSSEDKKYIKEIVEPVPQRSIGLVTHRYFVKKKILELLSEIIKTAVFSRLPNQNSEVNNIHPI